MNENEQVQWRRSIHFLLCFSCEDFFSGRLIPPRSFAEVKSVVFSFERLVIGNTYNYFDNSKKRLVASRLQNEKISGN